MNRKYAQVIIDNKASSTDKPYTYIISPDMVESIEEGMRVLVPFGRGNKVIKGIVIKIQEDYQGEYRLKKIIDIIDDKPLISKDMIELSLWLSRKYLSPYNDAFQTVLPPGDFKEVKTNIILKEINPEIYDYLNPLEKEIIDIINNQDGKMELEVLKGFIKNKITNKDIRELEKKNIIETSLEIQTSIEKKYEKFAIIKDKSISYDEMLNIIGTRSYKQLEIAKFLWNIDEISTKELMVKTNSSLSTIRALERKGIIEIFDKEVYRTPIKNDIQPYKKPPLSLDQKHCVDTILYSINNKEKTNKFLIHGVTGSGKTEIYLQLVEEMIKKGKETIVLVPEIALTPQTISRFVGRFGDNVAVLHSKLSFGERFDQWRKIKEGNVKIVVGARSAIFAPFNNLGLIIIDEEHESTYKSTMNPKYDAIEVAEKRCEQVGGFLVKGSATPSLESYYRSINGDIKLLNLKKRINDKKLPDVKIVDMREELSSGNKSIFSRELYEAIDENLRAGKQTILFLNRRGYSTFVSCRQCGYVVKCNECSISMTYHFKEDKLKCHYCGLAIDPPKVCPACNSKYIKYFGIGTEKVEEYTKKYFPKAVVKRMDMDTTSRKGSHESILNKMKDGKIDILIGTQMVAKGLDFKNVTLVGIIAADTSLNLPDFRSSERTFQLITQVAGRAGRGEFEGRVVVQTYSPNHYSIQYAKNHDYLAFYNKEILLRKEFNYPPFINLISIVVYGEDNKHIAVVTKEVYNALTESMEKNDLNELKDNIIGPFPAPLEKIKKNYRYQIIIKSKDEYMNQLKKLIEWVCIYNRNKINLTGVKFNIDINPNSIL
ncbi:primosomal protein N' [Clostridium sp. Cult2]|uniref:primosomal protein N' n=1 Tax=Clostridium sp. Cult2 TaxID=2079003 RepID=UPI001F00348A|nr:primosomal protein N' [Clostridium sp. Cult2]MCF6466434.1 primosomal protein N' [Clostridium sp. Cult2]